MAMLGTQLEGRWRYARLRVTFGARYASPAETNGQFDFAIIYRHENPTLAGFPGAAPVWQDGIAIAYRLR